MSEETKQVIITPVGNLAFTQYLTKKNDNGKFKAAILFDPDTKGLKELMEVFKEAAKAAGTPKAKLALKKYRQAEDGKEFPYAEGKYVLNYNNGFIFGAIDIEGNEIPLDSLKAGDDIKVAITTYPWKFKGRVGIGCNVQGIQLVESCADEDAFSQGEGGKKSTASYFGIQTRGIDEDDEIEDDVETEEEEDDEEW